MLNSISYWGNANHSHTRSHFSSTGMAGIKKTDHHQRRRGRADTGALGALLVAAAAENSLEGPRKIKHKYMTKQFHS